MQGNCFKVGDLVRDALNNGEGAYGLGVVVALTEDEENDETFHPALAPLKYQVYFTQFERIITFHGDYLEKV
tara:strand:- start:330 stop:545 length:216 start_codon:yes stop_codon:yes gene_type:complete